MNENKKISIFEGVTSLFGILSFVRLFLPAYWENGKDSITLLQMVFGNDRLEFNGLLFVGFLVLILAILLSLSLTLRSLTNKFFNEKTSTIFGISSGVFYLASAILLGLGIIVTGLYKENSELGLVQGNWGIGIGNILFAIFGFISFCLSYPAARIIPHHKDLKDSEAKKQKA